VGSFLVVEAKIGTDAGSSLGHALIALQINLLILETPP
jgi:hypothetical protein